MGNCCVRNGKPVYEPQDEKLLIEGAIPEANVKNSKKYNRK